MCGVLYIFVTFTFSVHHQYPKVIKVIKVSGNMLLLLMTLVLGSLERPSLLPGACLWVGTPHYIGLYTEWNGRRAPVPAYGCPDDGRLPKQARSCTCMAVKANTWKPTDARARAHARTHTHALQYILTVTVTLSKLAANARPAPDHNDIPFHSVIECMFKLLHVTTVWFF